MSSSNTSDYSNDGKRELARREGIKMTIDPEPAWDKNKHNRQNRPRKDARGGEAPGTQTLQYYGGNKQWKKKSNNHHSRQGGHGGHNSHPRHPPSIDHRHPGLRNTTYHPPTTPAANPHKGRQNEAYIPPHRHSSSTSGSQHTFTAVEGRNGSVAGLEDSRRAHTEDNQASIEAESVKIPTESDFGTPVQNSITVEDFDTVEDKGLDSDRVPHSEIQATTPENDVAKQKAAEEITKEYNGEREKVEEMQTNEALHKQSSESESQPQISVTEYEDLKQQLKERTTAHLNLQLQYSKIQQYANSQNSEVQKFQEVTRSLGDRIAAWVAVDKNSQLELKDLKETIESLRKGKTTWKEIADGYKSKLDEAELTLNHEVARFNYELQNERAQAQAAARGHVYEFNDMKKKLDQLQLNHSECFGKMARLRLELEDAEEKLELERLSHEETKSQLAATRAREDGLISELGRYQIDLQAAKAQAAMFETQVKGLETTADGNIAAMQELKQQLDEQREVSEHSSSPLVEESKKKRHIRKISKAKKEEERKNESMALVLHQPLVSSEHALWEDFGDRIVEAHFAKMRMDNPIFHDLHRIRFFPDWHVYFHQSVPQLNIKPGLESAEFSADGEVPQAGKSLTGNRSTEAPKSVKRRIKRRIANVFSLITQFIIYGIIILLFFTSVLPRTSSLGAHATHPHFVSAAPSCEVFNSAIKVVETTCSWTPPEPSPLALIPSSTIAAPDPLIAESHYFWLDAEELNGNCSSSDTKPNEQTLSDNETCDNQRQHSERRIAIGIAVTVVVPTVLVSGVAWAFGYI